MSMGQGDEDDDIHIPFASYLALVIHESRKHHQLTTATIHHDQDVEVMLKQRS